MALIDSRPLLELEPLAGFSVTRTSLPLELRSRATCSVLTKDVSIHIPGRAGSPREATVLARP